MIALLIIISIIKLLLIIRIIINQQLLDEHLFDSKSELNLEEIDCLLICNGIINKIIWELRVKIAELKYYINSKKEESK